MKLTLIATVGSFNELGLDNKLIWHLKDEQDFFNGNINQKKLIVGMNTFMSNERDLSSNMNLVLTHQDIEEGPNLKVFHTKEDLLDYIKSLDEEIMVVGGESMYNQFIDEADEILLSKIEDYAFSDSFFPEFDEEEWEKTLIYSKNSIPPITHYVYKRKNK